MPVNFTKAKAIAKTPASYTTEELHEALDIIVNDERFSERQVTTLQGQIEYEISFRKSFETLKLTGVFTSNMLDEI